MRPRIGSVGRRSRRSSITISVAAHHSRGGDRYYPAIRPAACPEALSSHFLMLRQRARDRMPGSLRAHEAMTLRLDPELTVQVAGRAEHNTRLRLHNRCNGPALPTERAFTVVRRLVGGDLVFSSHPAKARQRHRNKRGKRRPVMLTAHGAM